MELKHLILKILMETGLVNKTDFTGSDFSLFAESEIHPFEWMNIDAGLRYDQHIAPSIIFAETT